MPHYCRLGRLFVRLTAHRLVGWQHVLARRHRSGNRLEYLTCCPGSDHRRLDIQGWGSKDWVPHRSLDKCGLSPGSLFVFLCVADVLPPPEQAQHG